MKIEVSYVASSVVANSIDVDTYEGEHVDWVTRDGLLTIYTGTKADRVATYPEGRVVRVKVVE